MLGLALILIPLHATIQIDASRVIGPVNRLVFGCNLVAYQPDGYGGGGPEACDEGHGVWDPNRQQAVPSMAALAREVGSGIARWPGGCATHLYDWKKSIGPIAARPHQKFGLPEYLTVCESIGAKPLISVAEYLGTPQDAADLVEYLNSPNDGSHPWAAKRASDGHPQPVHAVWFEFGNESDHGPHRSNDDMEKVRPAYTAKEYVERYLQYRKAMRSVDASIQLGAVVSTGLQGLQGWPSKIASGIGKVMDYAIFHSYLPSVRENPPPSESLFRDSLAGDDQIGAYLDDLRSMLRSTTGRSIPIAITEFNGGFVQEKPVPYRHSLGNALVISDMLHLWLQPKNDVLFANFWEFPNEYWGMVRGFGSKGQPLVRRAQFYPAQMFLSHLGTKLIQTQVNAPTFDSDGNTTIGIEPHSGLGSKATDLETISIPTAWKISELPHVEQISEESVLQVRFHNPGDVNYYHANVEADALPNTYYRLEGWVKVENMPPGNGAAYQVGDARGWLVTHSAEVTPSITGTSGWRKVETVYRTLADTKRIQIVARRLSGTGPVTGTAWYKNLTLTRMIPNHYPAAPSLRVTSSRSEDGKHIYVVVTNRDLAHPIRSELTFKGFKVSHSSAITLTGIGPEQTNEDDPLRVCPKPIATDGRTILLPACSMTAITLDGTSQSNAQISKGH